LIRARGQGGLRAGEFVADMIVNDTVILELKSVRRIVEAHAPLNAF
jgi:hypothetical protein